MQDIVLSLFNRNLQKYDKDRVLSFKKIFHTDFMCFFTQRKLGVATTSSV